jgi:hypothetical protein
MQYTMIRIAIFVRNPSGSPYIIALQLLTYHILLSLSPRHRLFKSSNLVTSSIVGVVYMVCVLSREIASSLVRLHVVPTRVELAVPVLPDELERAGLAGIAGPSYQRIVRLDHNERVGAAGVVSE